MFSNTVWAADILLFKLIFYNLSIQTSSGNELAYIQRENGERVMSVRSSMVLLVLVATFLTVSCGDSVSAPNVSTQSGSIIIGEVNWDEATSFDASSEIRESANAVGDVQFANGGRCTGFFISEDVLMTNHHCIGSASDVVGMKVFMKHEKGVAKSSWAEVKCSQFIGNDEELDYALVKCEGSPGQVYGKVELDETQAVEGDSIYVVHQNCDYYTDYNCDWSKKVSQGKVVGFDVDVFYDADTLGGSSGSPVFNSDSNKVFAIHHAGYGGGWGGRGVKNGGVPMSKIVPHIKANFPSILMTSDDSGSSDDEVENNSFETSSAMERGFSKSVRIKDASDVDFYKADMKAGEVLDFRIFFSHAEGDLDFAVYKKVGSSFALVSKKQSSTNNEAIRLKVKSSQTYYIKVYGYKGATADYDVTFSK